MLLWGDVNSFICARSSCSSLPEIFSTTDPNFSDEAHFTIQSSRFGENMRRITKTMLNYHKSHFLWHGIFSFSTNSVCTYSLCTYTLCRFRLVSALTITITIRALPFMCLTPFLWVFWGGGNGYSFFGVNWRSWGAYHFEQVFQKLLNKSCILYL